MSGETHKTFPIPAPHVVLMCGKSGLVWKIYSVTMEPRAVSERMCRHRTLPSLPGRLDARVRPLVRMIFNKKGVELFSC